MDGWFLDNETRTEPTSTPQKCQPHPRSRNRTSRSHRPRRRHQDVRWQPLRASKERSALDIAFYGREHFLAQTGFLSPKLDDKGRSADRLLSEGNGAAEVGVTVSITRHQDKVSLAAREDRAKDLGVAQTGYPARWACDTAAGLVPLRPPARRIACRHDRLFGTGIKRQPADE